MLYSAAIPTVRLDLSSLGPYFNPKRVVLLFGTFEFVYHSVLLGLQLMNGTFELLVLSGE